MTEPVTHLPFKRIAIVNRGESAVRLIHAVAEWNVQHGDEVATIALHTHAERTAMHARMADEAHLIESVGTAFLDYDVLEQALVDTQADAVWVGWGFVAEHPEFADLCDRLGLTFIGPSGDVMRRLGDKIGAKKLAEEVGVPVAPWSNGPVESVEEAEGQAESIGYPLLIKATAGGGGRGIRRVDSPEDLHTAYQRACDEAGKAFGNPVVFMEHLVTGARHVEVQAAGDGQGGGWALGVRDCSIQRRNQKIIEESASPVLSDEHNRMLGKVAVDLIVAAKYQGVGTVEFLYDTTTDTFAFLEVNTRLQVEHPITELTTGVDIVKLQLEIAAGRTLEGDPPPITGHAIEVRLNAEDPSAGFAPAAGRITALNFPSGPGIRVDTGVAEGDSIQSEYDAMVAKIMAWGSDRAEARGRLVHALEETVVSIEGGATNKSFLLHLLGLEEVISGSAHTSWLDSYTAEGRHLVSDHAGVAVLVTGAEAYLQAAVYERNEFFASAGRGRPRLTHEPVTTVDASLRGEQYRMAVQRINPTTYRIEVDDAVVTLEMTDVSEFESRARIGDRTYRIMSTTQGGDHLIEVDHITHRVSRDDAGTIRSPSPSLVIATSVEPGDAVAQGDLLVVLEAMKMETQITAPFDGTIVEVPVGPSTQVDAGTPLVIMEAASDGEEEADGTNRIDFADLADTADDTPTERERLLACLDAIRWTVMGFDTKEGVVAELTAQLSDARDDALAHDDEAIAASLEILQVFSDIGSLARNRRAGELSEAEDHNAQEFLHHWLRSLDVEAEGLPESFQAKLSKAFAHYGVGDLEQGVDLERAAFRLFNAQEEAASHERLLAAVLNGLRLDPTRLDADETEQIQAVLGEFIIATELRFPDLGNLARSVRYETFDQPAIAFRQSSVLWEMGDHLDALRAGTPEALGETRAEERIGALVNCPETVIELLGESPGDLTGDPMLGVMFERLYRVKQLHDVQINQDLHSAGYYTDVSDGSGGMAPQLRYVVATITDMSDAEAALARALEHGTGVTTSAPLSIDLYLRWDGQLASAAEVAPWAEALARAADRPDNLRRISISGADPDGEVFHLTYRAVSGDDGQVELVEDTVIRNFHPMIAGRLQLGRFVENFHIERLPSRPDIYLFKLVGRANKRDSRLFAAAEVRDLTPNLDRDGTVIGLPAVERVVSACADAIRVAQTEHDPKRRMATNRITLYVWPPFDLPVSALDTIGERLTTPTAGLGLEGVEAIGTIIDRAAIEGGASEEEATHDVVVKFGFDAERGREFSIEQPTTSSVPGLDPYRQNVILSRQRGSIYPYELVEKLTRGGGTFTEYAVGADGSFDVVDRPPGTNQAGFVSGVLTTPTDRHPDGITRVLLMGDPTKGLASIAEAESRTVIAALDLAASLGVPVEWYAVSAGARIAMDTGTENMDWVSRALRRIIEFTQDGGIINIVVTGINVGAQPYWNAEATMLMHTKGILIMTPDSAMVLTGKQSLDYSGGVSAEDNFGIGGYDRIMGPNGEAQYWAPDLDAALELMRRHNELTFVVPGERFPRQRPTSDDPERDVGSSPHDGQEFATVGEIFSPETNPGRKKPFDIRSIMRAVSDTDVEPMERWLDMRDAETGVVFETRVDGQAVTMVGISSRSLPRTGVLPADGPSTWTSGTLFPMSSKKIARGINAASGNRPLIVLANLSGFDGSPESLRKWQLEFGAEIGRAMTNFDGPIVFCLVGRYHGGAFVVFSKVLNDNTIALAVEGTFASVLGGAPAAAVVFTREVDQRTDADPRITDLRERIAAASGAERSDLEVELSELRPVVRAEKLCEKAAEFDAVHTVERARDMGSVDAIIPPHRLRPAIIQALSEGMARATRG